MDDYTKFNRKSVDDRQVDTLIGLAKGILADGKVVPEELEFLYSWLDQSRHNTDNPIVINLHTKLVEIFADGVVDVDELSEMTSLLKRLTGEESELGELMHASNLPLDEPMPPIEFPGKLFLFTGTCVYGTRRECAAATEALGGKLASNVSKSVNYLVIGSYVTDSWIHETFGRKIEKAMEYRASGVPLAIVSESAWARAGRLTAG